MPKLNLQAKDETQKIIKEYLEEHVSIPLAEKINNGVLIQKDGKSLLNKKSLDGCIEFSAQEAQKLVEKGARAACIRDCVVFGWAIHYFEEDSIECTLYNQDGTEYKPKTTASLPASRQLTRRLHRNQSRKCLFSTFWKRILRHKNRRMNAKIKAKKTKNRQWKNFMKQPTAMKNRPKKFAKPPITTKNRQKNLLTK